MTAACTEAKPRKGQTSEGESCRGACQTGRLLKTAHSRRSQQCGGISPTHGPSSPPTNSHRPCLAVVRWPCTASMRDEAMWLSASRVRQSFYASNPPTARATLTFEIMHRSLSDTPHLHTSILTACSQLASNMIDGILPAHGPSMHL